MQSQRGRTGDVSLNLHGSLLWETGLYFIRQDAAENFIFFFILTLFDACQNIIRLNSSWLKNSPAYYSFQPNPNPFKESTNVFHCEQIIWIFQSKVSTTRCVNSCLWSRVLQLARNSSSPARYFSTAFSRWPILEFTPVFANVIRQSWMSLLNSSRSLPPPDKTKSLDMHSL